MKKILVILTAMTMIATIGTATTPEFNQNQDADATVVNTPPWIVDGWIVILNQEGVEVWNQTDPGNSSRADSYIWESEKLVVYAIIHDDNGESDLWQHTVKAYLSPADNFVTDLALVYFTNDNKTEALFKGEKLIPGPDIWQCDHDVYIEDTDKYGATATNSPYTIFYPLYINPEMSSTFTPDRIKWTDLHAGDKDVPADTNTHIEHVYAQCNDIPVYVNYELWIHGTDLEGGIGTSHVIPCENVEYSYLNGPWTSLTNGEVYLGEHVSCENISFDFRITVPWIEPGDYFGEVGFGIKAT